jgi:hypothetical protein
MLPVTIVRVDELHEKGIILTVSLIIIIFNASSSMTRTLLIHLLLRHRLRKRGHIILTVSPLRTGQCPIFERDSRSE